MCIRLGTSQKIHITTHNFYLIGLLYKENTHDYTTIIHTREFIIGYIQEC